MSVPIPDSIEATSFSPRRVIADAARETGADFDFLLRTAARESSFDARAEARTSSAAGLFQFIEQTWLGMLDRHGDKHGYGELAGAVDQDARGRFTIEDPAMRQRALDLRFDPRAASVMAGELAAENAHILRQLTGRDPGAGELYAAHFLGASGAAALINAAAADPNARADALFPAAAAANRPLFFKDGVPVTAAGLLADLTGQSQGPSRAPTPPDRVDLPALRAETGAGEGPDRARFGPPVSGYAAFRFGDGVLSPALVELLASLDMPERARTRG